LKIVPLKIAHTVTLGQQWPKIEQFFSRKETPVHSAHREVVNRKSGNPFGRYPGWQAR
jgi:hypothetical protein